MYKHACAASLITASDTFDVVWSVGIVYFQSITDAMHATATHSANFLFMVVTPLKRKAAPSLREVWLSWVLSKVTVPNHISRLSPD